MKRLGSRYHPTSGQYLRLEAEGQGLAMAVEADATVTVHLKPSYVVMYQGLLDAVCRSDEPNPIAVDRLPAQRSYPLTRDQLFAAASFGRTPPWSQLRWRGQRIKLAGREGLAALERDGDATRHHDLPESEPWKRGSRDAGPEPPHDDRVHTASI